MPGKYFVDTNILLYAHDRSAGLKHERARGLVERLWTSSEGVLSTQVLQDLCINLRRKIAHPLPVEEIRQILQDYISWEIVINTPDSILRALEIEVRYQISFWDALNSAGGGELGRHGYLFRGFVHGTEVWPDSGGEPVESGCPSVEPDSTPVSQSPARPPIVPRYT